jgi:hypothetical protein
MDPSNDQRFRWLLAAATIAMGGVAAAACTAEVQTRPVAVAEVEEVDDAPPDVEAYPRTYYEGHVVYLVNDRWYYPRHGRWVYYRREPAELVRRRPYVQQAPPARRVAPAPYGGGPPPAVRTR